jgi:hypothetical protein
MLSGNHYMELADTQILTSLLPSMSKAYVGIDGASAESGFLAIESKALTDKAKNSVTRIGSDISFVSENTYMPDKKSKSVVYRYDFAGLQKSGEAAAKAVTASLGLSFAADERKISKIFTWTMNAVKGSSGARNPLIEGWKIPDSLNTEDMRSVVVFGDLMNEAGFLTETVFGYTDGSDVIRAYNAVLINGKWHFFDAARGLFDMTKEQTENSGYGDILWKTGNVTPYAEESDLFEFEGEKPANVNSGYGVAKDEEVYKYNSGNKESEKEIAEEGGVMSVSGFLEIMEGAGFTAALSEKSSDKETASAAKYANNAEKLVTATFERHAKAENATASYAAKKTQFSGGAALSKEGDGYAIYDKGTGGFVYVAQKSKNVFFAVSKTYDSIFEFANALSLPISNPEADETGKASDIDPGKPDEPISKEEEAGTVNEPEIADDVTGETFETSLKAAGFTGVSYTASGSGGIGTATGHKSGVINIAFERWDANPSVSKEIDDAKRSGLATLKAESYELKYKSEGYTPVFSENGSFMYKDGNGLYVYVRKMGYSVFAARGEIPAIEAALSALGHGNNLASRL